MVGPAREHAALTGPPMSIVSPYSSAAGGAVRSVSAEQRVALERLFAGYMSSISAKAVVRNAVNKAERRGGETLAELRRQLSLSIKMLVPPGERDKLTHEIDRVLAGAEGSGSTSEGSGSDAAGSSRARFAALQDKARALSDRGSSSSAGRSASSSSASGPSRRAYPEVSADTTVVLVRSEADMNATRSFARDICKLVGLMGYPTQKVVTAVSELARNIARYAGEGRVCFRIDAATSSIVIVAEDHGPGIEGLDDILAGNYRSRTGLGRGLMGVKKLASRFSIETGASGTRVEIAFAY